MDEINDEDDSAGEDSDDEGLNSKLCTFTQTQKEFMNQHWYHCHTCKMVDGVGVCTVCAKVMNTSKFKEVFILGGVKLACKDPSFAQRLVIFANQMWQLPEWPF